MKTQQAIRLIAEQSDPKACSHTLPKAPPANEIERIQSLNELVLGLKNARNFQEKLRHATAKAKALTSADLAIVCLADKTGEKFLARAVAGDIALDEKGLEFALEENPILISKPGNEHGCTLIDVKVRRLGMPVFAKQIEEMGIRFCAVVPLQVNDRHLGFLFAGNRNLIEFTEAEQYLLSLVGNLLADEIDRKRKEEKHDRLETVLEQAAETIVITDRDGVIQYVNPSFESISGYKRHEVVGKRPNFLHSGQQDAEFYRNMWEILRAGGIWRGHLVNRRKDGNLYELDATISPIKNDKGEITDYVSVRKDVTQETLLRRQLYQAQKMEAIGTLAGGIAHDFNNLMMGIQGNISLMRMELSPNSFLQKRCRTIEKLVRKGAGLTRQLLGIAKGGKYQQFPTDISKLVSDSLEMFGRTRKEIRTHMAAAPRPCVAAVNPGQIDQVFLNLFVNARQAMPDGGHLYVRTELVSINGRQHGIENLKPGAYIKTTVRDTGTGIKRAIIDKIFDPFFTTREKISGTGLGLATTYGIIKNHGGFIQVQSRVNEGTSFEVFLPASEKSSEEHGDHTGRIAGGRETVMLVDDEATVLDICGEMLKRLGYNVISASRGEEAVYLFESLKNDIDLVVLDLIMPDMRGEEVYAHLAGLKPNVKVLLASGYALESQARKLLSRNTVGFIQKPYSMTDLSVKAREVLSKS